MSTGQYPECEKMKAVEKESQAIGDFIDWLKTKDISLMGWFEDKPYLLSKSTEELLAEFFEIDLKKIEEERREILKNME